MTNENEEQKRLDKMVAETADLLAPFFVKHGMNVWEAADFMMHMAWRYMSPEIQAKMKADVVAYLKSREEKVLSDITQTS